MTTSRPRASIRASASISAASRPRNSSSTIVSAPSVVSTSTSPAGMRMSRRTGSTVANDSVLIDPSLVLGVAGEAVAYAALRRSCAACERSHEPRVQRHALSGGRDLELTLERLGQAQRDACRRAVLRGNGGRLGGLRRDVDELRVRPGEAHLDVAV